ncbi:Yip1 family protein [Halarchaeum sp. P4]|uniref:Yip1 family protein n=1 Tax=Halarchaeum sp. P4 TaxID=3421639 RepID=UPI003EC0090E
MRYYMPSTPSVLTLLTDPDGFFAAKEPDDWGYLRPVLVVAGTGLLGAVSAYLMTSLVLAALPEDAQSVGAFIGLIGAAGGFLGPFLIWGVLAVVFFLISALFDGEGSLKKTAAYVGWGFLPQLLGSVVSLALTYVGLQGITPPSDAAQYQAFVQQLQSRPIFLLSSVLGVVFLLWAGFVWTFALKHARDLDLRQAAITVFVPVGLYALYQLSTYVQI